MTTAFRAQKIALLLGVAVGSALASLLTLSLSRSDGDDDDDDDDSLYLRSPDRSRFLEEPEECSEACCEQYKEECPSGNPLSAVPLFIQIVLIVVLICASAMFSGLTLGLMGLDKTGLEIVMDGGDEKNAAYARTIYPLRKNGNLLLCTLLLGNTAVNALLSILLADKAGGIIGFISSTFIILIFGEITPQALCSRYALEIGSRVVPLVRVIMIILYPIVFPLGWLLDRLLGEELTTTYSSSELLKMLEIHVKEDALDKQTATTMTGALTFKDTRVREVMTPLGNTFMLSVEEKLNFETIAAIFKTGYSRIPVYEISPDNVIGLLFVKDLIFVDPADETRIADFVQIFGRALNMVWPDDKLGDVLRELKTGKSHMALVRDVNNADKNQDPFYEIKGIITLEDIIEEILGEEIVDETDAFVDGTHSQRVDRAETFEWARLRLLDSKIVDEKLSREETLAVTAHLSRNYPNVVALLSETQLYRLIADMPVTILPTAEQEIGRNLPEDLLYEKGTPCETCTLVLSGKVTVLAGSDGFRSDVSSWSLLAPSSLSDSNYKPDFSAFVSSGPCRCLRITRARFATALDASTTERLAHQHAVSAPPSTHGSIDIAPNSEVKDRSRKGQLLAALQVARRASHGPGSAGETTGMIPKVDLKAVKPEAPSHSKPSDAKDDADDSAKHKTDTK